MRDTITRGALIAFLGALILGAAAGCRNTASGIADDTDSNVEWVKDRF